MSTATYKCHGCGRTLYRESISPGRCFCGEYHWEKFPDPEPSSTKQTSSSSGSNHSSQEEIASRGLKFSFIMAGIMGMLTFLYATQEMQAEEGAAAVGAIISAIIFGYIGIPLLKLIIVLGIIGIIIYGISNA